MTTPTRWDVVRQKKKGLATGLPKCSSCGKTSVLDPCGDCIDTPEPIPAPWDQATLL